MKLLAYSLTSVLCSLSVCAARAESDAPFKDRRSVTVQGTGKVKAAPDMARLSVEVTQEGKTVEEVATVVRRQISQVLDALKTQGISDKDIQTQSYSIQPKFSQDKQFNQHRAGYVVTNQVEVTIHDLKKVGKVLSAVEDAGANSVNGPDFDFENPQALERAALAKAMDDAKAKASVLAQAGGATLGEALTINQSGGVAYPIRRPLMAMARAMSVQESAPEPIATGEQDFSSTVTVMFALK